MATDIYIYRALHAAAEASTVHPTVWRKKENAVANTTDGGIGCRGTTGSVIAELRSLKVGPPVRSTTRAVEITLATLAN